MRKVCNFCDYFLILSANSEPQLKAISEAIAEDLAKDRIKSLALAEGQIKSGWVVLDYSGVIVHIFSQPMREFYSLERLWSEAKRMRVLKPRKKT